MGAAWQTAARPQAHAAPSTSPSASANHYIDPATCAVCHASIAKSFALTGMGRSFAAVTATSLHTQSGAPIPLPAEPYFHAPSQTYYMVVARGGQLIEQQWQAGYDGQRMNYSERSIDYVLGSGNHGMTFLHLTARHTLEQLPFGWYAENGGEWLMNPGYDRPDHAGTSRLIGVECMFCHNGYPQHGAPADEGAEPVFGTPLPNGIDCQRCHGPGERHVAAASTPGATAAQIRAAIVNPARLGPTREMEVCMQCHLETTSLMLPHSTQRVGRTPFSYRPGQPLGDFRLSFDRAPGKNTQFVVAGAAYRLRQSQCFLQTQSWAPARRMQCTTCHDPHNIPRGEAANTHYNAICLTCHGVDGRASAAAAVPATAAHTGHADCISCHMPKRRTDDGIHIVMTEHDIQLKPPADALAPKIEHYESEATSYRGPVELYYPATLEPTARNQLDLAVAQVKDDSNLKAGIAQLSALIVKYQPPQADYYTALADALHDNGEAAASARMYEEALRHSPGSAVILLRLGHAQVDWQQWPQAEATLRQVTIKTPNDPVPWALLGQTLFEENRDAEARQALEKAVTLNPDLADPHNYLGGLAMRAGDAAGAEAEFRKALEIEPNSADWQANLAGLLASEGKLPEAGYLFRLSIRLNPALASTHLNYGRLLAAEGNNAAAEAQAKAAVDADGGNVEALDLWGYLLLARGDAAAAVRELTRAVKLQAAPSRANLDLAAALAQTGDTAGAQAQIRIAAGSSDPALRAAAQQMLAQH